MFDKTETPIHAVASFYDSTDINGRYEKRPHIVVTFYGHNYESEGGRMGIIDVVKNAIEKGNVLHMDKK